MFGIQAWPKHYAALAVLLPLLLFISWIPWQSLDASLFACRSVWDAHDNPLTTPSPSPSPSLPPAEVAEMNAPPKDPAIHDEYLAVCLAVKNQGLDLPEWLKHHYYNMGIKRFYIMDDGSEPPMSTMVNHSAVPEEALTFVYFPPEQHVRLMQQKVYDECIYNYGMNHTWIAFIDADEFFDIPGNQTLEEILKALEPLKHIGALGVNWQMHTSSGLLTRAASVLSAYTECVFDDEEHNGEASDNKHIKSIVRVSAYDRSESVHRLTLKDNAITVGEFADEVTHPAFRQPISRERVSLHHYAVKSREEYEQKMQRSNAVGEPKTWEFWDHVQNIPHVECKDMLRWAEKI